MSPTTCSTSLRLERTFNPLLTFVPERWTHQDADDKECQCSTVSGGRLRSSRHPRGTVGDPVGSTEIINLITNLTFMGENRPGPVIDTYPCCLLGECRGTVASLLCDRRLVALSARGRYVGTTVYDRSCIPVTIQARSLLAVEVVSTDCVNVSDLVFLLFYLHFYIDLCS